MNKAYTLIEVLIALAIGAMIIAAGGFALSTYLRTEKKVREGTADVERTVLAQLLLRKQLVNYMDKLFGVQLGFIGTSDYFLFFTSGPAPCFGIPGAWLIKVELKDGWLVECVKNVLNKDDLKDWTQRGDYDRCVGLMKVGDKVDFSYYLGGEWRGEVKRNKPEYLGLRSEGDLIMIIPTGV